MRLEKMRFMLCCLGFLILPILGVAGDSHRIGLEGDWRFSLDRLDEEKGWPQGALTSQILLPGSTDEQGYGTKVTEHSTHRLSRRFSFEGPAWYERDVRIPDSWRGKNIRLHLERCHWESQVRVDDVVVKDRQNSLSVPHVFDLTELLSPGKHTLSIRMDNTRRINIGHTPPEGEAWNGLIWSHAITEETQTNWNGIIGDIFLECRDKVRIEQVDAYPRLYEKAVLVKMTVLNDLEKQTDGVLQISAATKEGGDHFTKNLPVVCNPGESIFQALLPLGESPVLWSEFEPNLYNLEVQFSTEMDQERIFDKQTLSFGMRDFEASYHRFHLNGRPVFLRGTVDCAVWPLTGYPPMDEATWLDYLQNLKDYGYNHVRFHSWCPPEAAFAAADELGMMLQIEAPLWDGHGKISAVPERVEFIESELQRILRVYGNHPSFCMLSIGNELGQGKDPVLGKWVDMCRELAPRHLYTRTTHPYGTGRNDDYFVTAHTDRGGIRGVSNGTGTDADHDEPLRHIQRPVIAHETGQYSMFIDYQEMERFTGVLAPENYAIFHRSMEQAGLLDQAENFRRASGRLIARLYKEELEKGLRSENLAGYQTLGLYDYPGHGTAVIGLVDVFGRNKGILSAKEYRCFNNSTVLLLRMEKRNWLQSDTFQGTVQVAHYGSASMPDFKINWEIVSQSGHSVAGGTLNPVLVKTGGVAEIGELSIPLMEMAPAEKYELRTWATDPDTRNNWDIWVWPEEEPQETPEDVLVCTKWDDQFDEAIRNGGKVLLLPNKDRIDSPIKGSFLPAFWSLRLFGGQAGTLGITCDPDHHVFRSFPTDGTSNWQWRDLLEHSKPLVLDDAPESLVPLVQVIDDFGRNHKIATLIEGQVGKASVVVSTMNLRDDLNQRHAAKQLRAIIMRYMGSKDFDPTVAIEADWLRRQIALETIRDAGPPPSDARVLLSVEAASEADENTAKPWSADLDLIRESQTGWGYALSGAQVWRDAVDSAWFSDQMTLEIQCPEGFEGALYCLFRDWDHNGRRARLTFEGETAGTLGNHDGPGVWFAQNLTQENTKDGRVRLEVKGLAGPNVTLSEIVVVESELLENP